MRLTLNINDEKANLILELLKRFEDIVTIETVQDIPVWHKTELENRLEAYRVRPAVEQWDNIEAELEKL